MRARVGMLFLVGLTSLCSGVYAQKTITPRRDSPVVKGLPIKCSGADYTWAGMLRERREKDDTHRLQTVKDVNATPLDVAILENATALMVDNEEFKILRSNAKETFAMFVNEENLIAVVLNYQYGTLLYSKVFTNVDVGIQNAMSFVATCKNY